MEPSEPGAVRSTAARRTRRSRADEPDWVTACRRAGAVDATTVGSAPPREAASWARRIDDEEGQHVLLEEKVAIVTGSVGGIGRRTAEPVAR